MALDCGIWRMFSDKSYFSSSLDHEDACLFAPYRSSLFFIDGSLLIVQFGFDELARSAAVLLLAEFSIDKSYEQRDLLVLWHDLF